MEDNTLDFFDLYVEPTNVEPEKDDVEKDPVDPIDTETDTDTDVATDVDAEHELDDVDPAAPDVDSDTEEEDDYLKVNFDYLKQMGALILPDDYEFKATEKGFQKALEDSKVNAQRLIFEQMFEELPQQGREVLNYFYQGGRDIQGFLKLYEAPDYAAMDVTDNEAVQEAIVREHRRKTTKFSEAKIEKELETLKDSYRLAEEAEEARQELANLSKAEKEAKLEADRAASIAERQAIQQEITELGGLLKTVKEVNGIPIENKDASLIINSLYKPIKLTDGTTTTSFNFKLTRALADPKLRALLAKLVETDFDFSTLARKTETKAAIALKERLKESQRQMGGRLPRGTGNFDVSTADLDFK